MENEIMNYDETMTEEVELDEVENKTSMGTGAAMLLGAGLAVATTAIVKFGKKAIAAYKAKKARKAEEEDYEEVAD